jgi:hypothetical protein
MRWIAYVSMETGGAEVYVRPFRVSERTGMPALGEGKWQVSKDGGNWPRWRSGKEIIFDHAPWEPSLFAAPVKVSGAIFESGVPQLLFPGTPFYWDSTPDGQRFLLAVPQVQKASESSISVVLNWPALLKK